VLDDLAGGNHSWGEVLKSAKKPMLVLGMGALTRPDGAQVLAAARRLAEAANMVREDWNGFNVLHAAASRVGGLDIGFVPGPGGRDRDAISRLRQRRDRGGLPARRRRDRPARFGTAFVIYQGHHGDAGAHRADVVLPAAAYTEKDALYVNTEGRVQPARRATFPPGDAREDWKILRALSRRSAQAALRHAAAASPPSRRGLSAVRRDRRGGEGGVGQIRCGRADRAVALCLPDRRFSTVPTRSAAPRRRWRNAAR